MQWTHGIVNAVSTRIVGKTDCMEELTEVVTENETTTRSESCNIDNRISDPSLRIYIATGKKYYNE